MNTGKIRLRNVSFRRGLLWHGQQLGKLVMELSMKEEVVILPPMVRSKRQTFSRDPSNM